MRHPALFVLAASLVACARISPEQRSVGDAAAAVGDRAHVLALATLAIDGCARRRDAAVERAAGGRAAAHGHHVGMDMPVHGAIEPFDVMVKTITSKPAIAATN